MIHQSSDKSDNIARRLDGYKAVCDEISLRSSVKSMILNSAGTVIGHKNQKLVTKQYNVISNAKKLSALIPLANIERNMIKGKTGFGDFISDGYKKFIAYAPVSGTGWSLSVVADENDIMGGSRILSEKTVSISAFFILLIVLLCLFTIKRLVTKPFGKAARMMRSHWLCKKPPKQ